MSPPGQQTTPHWVKVACEHCSGGIEFDSNQLADWETCLAPCLVPCPHCQLNTTIFVPEEDALSPVICRVQPCVSAATPHYVTVACEHCDCGIEFDANQLAEGETRVVQCPHCHLEATLLVVEEGKSTPSPEPVALTRAGVAPAFSIPAPPVSLRGSVVLDLTKVAALKAESARVSVLLGAIFAECEAPEAEERPVQTQAPEDAPTSLLNLNPGHQGLLQVLLQRPRWTRAELEELCADRGLMVDGAIECINEAAFDQFGRALIEGNEQIDINLELVQKKKA
jgi:hypothetical protein